MTINDILKTANLSQTELSRRFGIPLRTVQNWACGINKPSEWVVNLIAAALNVTEKNEEDNMKKYFIADNADFYGAFEKCVFDMVEIERLAGEFETSAAELMERYEIHEADVDEISMYADASGIESKPVFIARVATEYEDVYEASFDKETAVKAAETMAAHLTAKERKTHTVSVEKFTVPVADGWDAKTAFRAACLADVLKDVEEYETITD